MKYVCELIQFCCKKSIYNCYKLIKKKGLSKMKKIIAIIFSILFLNNSANAEIGVNIGVSGQLGIFAASASETTGGLAAHKDNGSEHGAAGWGSVFIEKTLGDRLLVGIDYVPSALATDTTETSKQDMRTDDSSAVSPSTNKVQIDFEDLTTYYVGINLSDNFYAKAGIVTVDVITNESLGTGSTYGNTDLDGTMLGVGYNNSFDNGAFVRVETNYMDFDGATVTSSANSNKIELSQLHGVSGKISIGKSF